MRVWIDDRHPIFRRGLAACAAGAGFDVRGESAGLDPTPALAAGDALVAEAEHDTVPRLASVARGAGACLVALVRPGDERTLHEAVDVGAAAVLLRSDLTPANLAAALQAVAAGSTAMPAGVVARLLDRAARNGTGGPRSLTNRELAVLRLLSQGNDTRDIGDELNYSERTVKNIVHDVLMKMNCRNRAHVVAVATRQGLI